MQLESLHARLNMRGNLLPAASTVLDRNELFFDKGAQSAGICGEVDVKLCAGRFALQIENTGTVIDMKLHECKQAGFGGCEIRIDNKCRNVRAEAGFLLLCHTGVSFLSFDFDKRKTGSTSGF